MGLRRENHANGRARFAALRVLDDRPRSGFSPSKERAERH